MGILRSSAKMPNDGRWIADCHTVTCIRPSTPTTGTYLSKEQVVKLWNRTPPVSEPVPEVAEDAVIAAVIASIPENIRRARPAKDDPAVRKAFAQYAVALLSAQAVMLDEAKEALRFYTTVEFYRYQPECGCSSIEADSGETASIMLSKMEAQSPPAADR